MATFLCYSQILQQATYKCLPLACSLRSPRDVLHSPSSIHEMLIELIPHTVLPSCCLFLGQVTVVSNLVMRLCRVCVHVGTEIVSSLSPSLRPLPCPLSPSGQHSLDSLLPHGYALRCHMTHRETTISLWSTGRLECHNWTSLDYR